jgi:hypothetical protein
MSAEVIQLNQITLRVNSVQDVRQTADLVRVTLGLPLDKDAVGGDAKQHRAGEPKRYRQDVAVVVPEELLEQARVTRLMFMLMMGLIAAISLLVGGIGIMNIMLATVTERTREIGIRRALGATRLHIITQFLVETISLSVVGGVTGVDIRSVLSGDHAGSARHVVELASRFDGQDAGGRPDRHTRGRPRVDPDRLWDLCRRRHRVRHLSGHPCCLHGSDRSAATRIERRPD